MTVREALEQIRDAAAQAASAYPASGNIALIQQICEQQLAADPGKLPLVLWAAWHPQHGFAVPHQYEGAVAWADLDPVAREVRNLNADDKTNNRTGWRATKAVLVKVAS
jgi:hypothetical protein